MERRPFVFLYGPVVNDPNYILGAGAEAASLVTAGKSLVATGNSRWARGCGVHNPRRDTATV